MPFSEFQRSKDKNVTKIEQKRLFVYIYGFILYGASRAKTDLDSKYII